MWEVQTFELDSRKVRQRLILCYAEYSVTVTVEISEWKFLRRRDLTESQYVSDTVTFMLSLEFARTGQQVSRDDDFSQRLDRASLLSHSNFCHLLCEA